MPSRPLPPKLPPTVTRPALLPARSDQPFRALLYNFFTVANRLEEIRRRLGSRIGVSGPQYTLLMAVAELQESEGVRVGRVADHLHVTGAFVTAESGKLSKKGYLRKCPDPGDGRVSLLSVGAKGAAALESLFPDLQHVNDQLFDLQSRDEFRGLCATLQRMAGNSRRALALIAPPERHP